jgi:hypothetical protein
MTSKKVINFLAGELGDAGEVMEWMGWYDDVLLYRERIAKCGSGC